MMEIKFCAYVKDKKKVLPVYSLDFSWIESEPVTIASCGDLNCGMCLDTYERNSVEIMQYTGLKDKNGKEIYEGYILGKEGHWSFYIGFKDACFVMIPCNSVQRVNFTWHPVGQDMIEGWEAIGNIYENPELLETSK